MKTIQIVSGKEADSSLKNIVSLKNSQHIKPSKYKPSELESIFSDALTSLEKQDCVNRVEVLENLCKDFLKTITQQGAFVIQLSTLNIKAKKSGQHPIEEANARYESLLKDFTQMRQQYQREIALSREDQKFKFLNRKQQQILPNLQVNFFDDLKHLTQQNIYYKGVTQRNPDFLSADAQLAINQRFDWLKCTYETTLQCIQTSNDEMQQTMVTFQKVNEMSKTFFKIQDINIASMVKILGFIVKSDLVKSDKVKALEMWLGLEQHLGKNFFTEVIAQFYGLEQGPVSGMLTRFEENLSQLKESNQLQFDQHKQSVKVFLQEQDQENIGIATYVSEQVDQIWVEMRQFFVRCEKQIEQKYLSSIQEMELNFKKKQKTLQESSKSSVKSQQKVDQNVRLLESQKEELVEELASLTLKFNNMEYKCALHDVERDFYQHKVKQELLHSFSLREQIYEAKEAYFKQQACFVSNGLLVKEQAGYIESLQMEVERLTSELKRLNFMYPDLNNMKVNPNSIVKHLIKKSVVSGIDARHQTDDLIFRPSKINVSCNTEICNLKVEIIEKFKMEKRLAKPPTINSSTQTDEIKQFSATTQTFVSMNDQCDATDLSMNDITKLEQKIVVHKNTIAANLIQFSEISNKLNQLLEQKSKFEDKCAQQESLISGLQDSVMQLKTILSQQKLQITNLQKNELQLQRELELKEEKIQNLKRIKSVGKQIRNDVQTQENSRQNENKIGIIESLVQKIEPNVEQLVPNQVLLTKIGGMKVRPSTAVDVKRTEFQESSETKSQKEQTVENYVKDFNITQKSSKLPGRKKNLSTGGQSTTYLSKQSSANYEIKLPNSLQGLERYFELKQHKQFSQPPIINRPKTVTSKNQIKIAISCENLYSKTPDVISPSSGETNDLYKAYKNNLIESLREPNFYAVDQHQKQIQNLKQIVKGRSYLKK